MAVRVFEGKDHAAAYLQYRIAPDELISRIMSYMEKKKSSSKRVQDAKAYREGLGPQEKARYFEKLRFTGGADPYKLAPSSWIHGDPVILPSVAYPDIVNYLVFSLSPYTAEDLKSYKGLEAYNQMVCEWVRETQYQVINNQKAKTSSQFNLAVDVGCGSGQGTILLAPYFTKVVGTDVSPAQLEMALANSSPPNVSYRECPAEVLPFASGEVDLVTAIAAAHWFDHKRFLLEADRVLRPGGCLALVSYTMDFELEYGGVSNTALNDICEEYYDALRPFRNPYIGTSSVKIYSDLFDSCSYPDKEWNECLRVKRILPLSGYIGMVETFSTYQALLQKDPAEAKRLSNDTRNKLMSAMKVSSPDTEVTVVVKYFYWLAHKP